MVWKHIIKQEQCIYIYTYVYRAGHGKPQLLLYPLPSQSYQSCFASCGRGMFSSTSPWTPSVSYLINRAGWRVSTTWRRIGLVLCESWAMFFSQSAHFSGSTKEQICSDNLTKCCWEFVC